MNLIGYADFAIKIGPDLVKLGKALFVQTKGDVAQARAELKRIPDHWAGVEEGRARRDREFEELKAKAK